MYSPLQSYGNLVNSVYSARTKSENQNEIDHRGRLFLSIVLCTMTQVHTHHYKFS